MKREGWQHGMEIRRRPCNQKFVGGSSANGGPISGSQLARSSCRPDSHSKYTGKCRRARCTWCHSHPVSKARDKAKGAHKLRSCDVALNHRLVSWRVVDEEGCGNLNYEGMSATGILSRLSGSDCWNEGDHGDYNEDDDDDEVGYNNYNEEEEEEEHILELLIGCSDAKEEDKKNDEDMMMEIINDEDDCMGFLQVGFLFEHLDEEDWCMVSEMP